MLPTTKLYKLDLQFITDNCLNKKLWPKKWRIFEYDKIAIDLALVSIDVRDNKLRLGISMSTKDLGGFSSNDYFNRGDIIIPLDRDQQNMENAKRQLVSVIRQRVINYERGIAQTYIGYQRALDYDNALVKRARERAEEILDAEKITNYDIRNAYIEACADTITSNRSGQFLNDATYITRPHYYLMLAAYFYPGNDLKYKEALTTTNTNKKTKWYTEYKEEMKEYIKAVHEDNVEEFINEISMDFEDIR